MPDGGSARCDFPGGDAGELYDSIMKVLSLPDETRLFMCHDYGPNGRAIQWETTVAAQKADNIHVGGGKTRAVRGLFELYGMPERVSAVLDSQVASKRVPGLTIWLRSVRKAGSRWSEPLD